MNCAYKGGASREGEEDNVSFVRMGNGVKFGGIFERLGREGVGEDGEEEGKGMHPVGIVGILRFNP